MIELDGLRGVAALMVVIEHLLPDIGITRSELDFGAGGVIIFFVLSGFLMGHLYLLKPFTKDAAKGYGVARIARIVPIYFLVVIVSYLISRYSTIDFAYRVDARQLLRLLTFNGSASVFWSVGPEFQFYFFFIGVWMITALRSRARTLACVALVAFVFAAFVLSPRTPGVLFVSKLHIFLAGVGIAVLRARVVDRLQHHAIAIGVLQLLAILAMLLISTAHGRMLVPVFGADGVSDNAAWFYSDPARALLAALVVFAFTFSTRVSAALLGNGPVRKLGLISFSLYLLHLPVIDVLRTQGIFVKLDAWAAMSICIAASIAVALLSSACIETPIRAAITSRFATRRDRDRQNADASALLRPAADIRR